MFSCLVKNVVFKGRVSVWLGVWMDGWMDGGLGIGDVYRFGKLIWQGTRIIL